MGICAKYFSIMCILCLGVSLCGDTLRQPVFSSVDVKFRLVNPPRIKTGGSSSVDRGSIALQNQRWGVLEIKYTPRVKLNNQIPGKKGKVAGMWLDDVSCIVRLVCRDSSNRREPGNSLFTTTVEFWTIPLDDNVHKYFVYLPPMLIERVMPVVRNDSSKIKIASDKNFVAAVSFVNKKWGLLGEGYCGMNEHYPSRYFAELERTVPKNCVFHGSLVSRANSPWGMNNVDHFDLEKPAFIPAPPDAGALEKAAQIAGGRSGAASGKSSSSQSAGSKKNRKNKR